MATYYRDKSLPNRFLQCRLDKGLTQQQLAEKLGLKRRAILNYEKGITYPKMEILLEMHRVLDVSLDYLIALDIYPNHIGYIQSVIGLEDTLINKLSQLNNEISFIKLNKFIHFYFAKGDI